MYARQILFSIFAPAITFERYCNVAVLTFHVFVARTTLWCFGCAVYVCRYACSSVASRAFVFVCWHLVVLCWSETYVHFRPAFIGRCCIGLCCNTATVSCLRYASVVGAPLAYQPHRLLAVAFKLCTTTATFPNHGSQFSRGVRTPVLLAVRSFAWPSN